MPDGNPGTLPPECALPTPLPPHDHTASLQLDGCGSSLCIRAQQNGMLSALAVPPHPLSCLHCETHALAAPPWAPTLRAPALTTLAPPASSSCVSARFFHPCITQVINSMARVSHSHSVPQTSPMLHDQASLNSQNLPINPAKTASSLPIHPKNFICSVLPSVMKCLFSGIQLYPICPFITGGLIYSLSSLLRGSLFSISAILKLPAEKKTNPYGTHTTLESRRVFQCS